MCNGPSELFSEACMPPTGRTQPSVRSSGRKKGHMPAAHALERGLRVASARVAWGYRAWRRSWAFAANELQPAGTEARSV